MKNLLWILILTCLPSVSFARFGGGAGDGGGGHGFSSTPEEIRAYVNAVTEPSDPFLSQFQLSQDWGNAYARLSAWQLLDPNYAPNETIRRVLQAMARAYRDDDSSVNRAGLEAIKKMKLDPEPRCRGGEDEHFEVVDAATIHKPNSPICINVTTLARYPRESLQAEIIPLLFHEWTHQLGFGETEAIEFQGYIKHYIEVVLATLNEPAGNMPIRVGGRRTIAAEDGHLVTFSCFASPKQYLAWMELNHTHWLSDQMVIFANNNMEFNYTSVACGDLPQLNCHEEPGDKFCQGSYVRYGSGKADYLCVGKESPTGTNYIPSEYQDLQALRDAKICK